MPFDNSQASSESKLLLFEIKSTFSKKIQEARSDEPFKQDLTDFAKLCVDKKITCITFNYDDLFDQYLWEVKRATNILETLYWHPDGGYGFFCRPSEYMVRNPSVSMDNTAMLLLKLHGSMNWRVRRGDRSPFTIDSIFHHEDWFERGYEIEQGNKTIELHLEPEPFFVPPLFTKEELTKQPVLKLIWSLAYEKLEAADNIIFIGYSLPKTDIASEFLFNEAISKDSNIFVVNLKKTKKEQKDLRQLYSRIFPKISNFYFNGALDWVKDITKQNSI